MESGPGVGRAMITGRIKAMLEACEAGNPSFPPNVLFNESWLLRIVMDWFERHGGDRYPMSPRPGARWFSEAWLPSAFLPRYRGDRLAESRTHADGVVGHFTIGDPGTAGLTVLPDAKQFVVIECKLFNRLSAGVKNAPYFDQASRSVACMAEALRRAGREPSAVDDLALLVVAPQARIDDGVFAWDTSADAIRRKVRRRVEDYAGERDDWYHHWFLPTLRRIDVRSLSWEDVAEAIAFHDPRAGHLIDSFYGQCLRFNRPQSRANFPGRRSGSSIADWYASRSGGGVDALSGIPRPENAGEAESSGRGDGDPDVPAHEKAGQGSL
jgi:hypothetical protein